MKTIDFSAIIDPMSNDYDYDDADLDIDDIRREIKKMRKRDIVEQSKDNENIVAPSAKEIESFRTEDDATDDAWVDTDKTLTTYESWDDVMFNKHAFKQRKTAFSHTITGSANPVALQSVALALGGKRVEMTIPSTKDSITTVAYLLNCGKIAMDIHAKDASKELPVLCKVHLNILDEDNFNIVRACFAPLITKKVDASNKLFMFVATMRGMTTEEIGTITSPLVEDNYSPEVVAQYRNLVEYLSSGKADKGKLALLDGPAGTGKSYCLRGVVSETSNISPILILPQAISELSGPQLLRCLLDHKSEYCQDDTRILLLVEDADSCLLPRMSDNMDSVSSLLNLTDGMIGDALNVFILMTTNAHKPDIEPALMRAGRMSHTINVGPLPADQANKVYRNGGGTEDIFTSPTKLCDIYQEIHKNNNTEPDAAVDVRPVQKKPKGRVGF